MELGKIEKEITDEIKVDNSDYNFPIDLTKIDKDFMKQFEIRNTNFKVDEFEELILQDVMRFDENTRIKLSRDMTKTFSNWMIGKIEKKENISLSIKGQTRCIVGDTMVLKTNFTETPIKNIKLNDELFCLNENNNSFEKGYVIEKYLNGVRKVYEITLKGGKNIIVSDNHPFLTMIKIDYKRKNIFSKQKWVQLKNLDVGDYIATPKKLTINHKKTDYNLCELELIGFWIGDGYLKRAKDYQVVCFDLSKKDKIDYFENLVNRTKLNYTYSQFEYKSKNPNWANGNKLQFKKKEFKIKCKDDFTKIIFQLNLNNSRAKNKFIPKEILKGTQKELYSVLSGLINSDGNIDITKGIKYATISKLLINDIETLLLKLDIFYSISKKKTMLNNVRHNDIYSIIIRRKVDLVKILKYCNLRTLHRNNLITIISKKSDRKRNVAPINNDICFNKIISIKYVGKRQTYDITLNKNHNFIANKILVKNSGKSVVTLKFTNNNVRYYNKPFDTSYIVCANQKEYRLKLNKAKFGDVFQIDENAFANVGEGSMTETHQLKDIQNIIAKQNIHTYYITPRTFLSNNAELGLSYWGKDVNNWCSRFLLYSLKSANPILMGYVIINVGSLFSDYGCFLYRLIGGCANSNRLKLKKISKDNLVFDNFQNPKNIREQKFSIDYLKNSCCIPIKLKNNADTDLKELKLNDEDKEKVPCPFYRICKNPMSNYEHKKDEWIAREMKGGMDERSSERFRVALELIKKMGFYDEENNRFMLKAKGKSDLKIKVSLFMPKISNTKFTGTETETIINTIQSLSDLEILTETCKLLELDFITQLKQIEGTENLVNNLKQMESKK